MGQSVTEEEKNILIELWCGRNPSIRYWNMPRLAPIVRDLKKKGLVEYCPKRMGLKITDKGIMEVSPIAEPSV